MHARSAGRSQDRHHPAGARARIRGLRAAIAAIAVTLGGLGLPQAAWAQAAPDGAPAPKETEEEREARKVREANERLLAMEELFLRAQLEHQLNQLAKWNSETGEILLKEGDLGGLEIPLEIFLEEIAEPVGNGPRLRFKTGVKIRPFALAIQSYMAAGGMKDVEALQKGETPFAGSVPPRVFVLVGDLLAALNVQDQERLEAERQREEQWRAVQDELADRLGLEREAVELYGRIAREAVRRLTREAEDTPRALDRARGFSESPRAARLARRVTESEAVLAALDGAEERLAQLRESPAGEQLQAELESFRATEPGRALESQLEAFLRSPMGQRAIERWQAIERARRARANEEDARPETPRAEPRAEPRRERRPRGERRERGERAPRPDAPQPEAPQPETPKPEGGAPLF